ncbi:zinc finger protein 16-like isoform X4 [Ctenopharyngodon idella]|uniref:zinc finger protein 16-like isoform X4 n=1 Tax=Ctenopharyngodon idella TaxID=7959 RepID=UPI00222F421E|nr:zinc finger protein 16-like isoform X4 [Ctenopharyngodon idella]
MNTSDFQTQLTSIMEIMARTAVAEISKLFEENSLLLRLEISRCTNENESLKKKCDFLESELQSARKTAGKMNGTEAPFSHPGLRESGRRPTIDNVFGKEWCMNLWRHQESNVGKQEGDTHLDSKVITEEPVNLLDEEPDVIMIKEETLKIDDCSGKNKPEADQSNSLRGPAMTSDESCVAQSSEDFTTVPSDDHMKLRRQLRKDKNILDGTIATHGNSVTGSVLSPDVECFPSKVKRKRKRVTNTQKLKKLKCVLCEKTFEYLSRLQKHMRTHSGEKPFVCTVCGRRFSQKPSFLLHERTHSGERPYAYT